MQVAAQKGDQEAVRSADHDGNTAKEPDKAAEE